MIHPKKSLFLKILTVAFAASLIFPVSAAVAQDATSIYGYFGQPHNEEVSGDFLVIVETHDPVDKVTFRVVKADKPDAVLGTYSQTSVMNGQDGVKYFRLVWNSTGFENGNYKMLADVECSSCSADNAKKAVVHYAYSAPYLMFIVDNPETIAPVSSNPPETVCSNKLDDARSVALRVYQKHKTNLLYIDSFLQQTTLFYEKSKLDVQGHADALDQVGQLRKEASDNLVALEQLKDFTCDGSLKDQADSFLDKSGAARDSLDAYKDSVIELILSVVEGL